ncbi:MAG: SRPBCC family protein [Candidatus Nanopelagicales bacterium]|nr:SRPBCC family protein [Candidatus Nanopelagicales bacterium]
MAERTESSTTIDAAPAAIMAVIADLAAYPQWSEGITSVEVLESQGDRPVLARFVLDAGLIKDTYVLRYDWHGDTSVTWSLVEAGMLTLMDGAYALEPQDAATTSVAYSLTVDVRIPLLGMLKRKAEKVIVDTALLGLKKRVEGDGTRPGQR